MSRANGGRFRGRYKAGWIQPAKLVSRGTEVFRDCTLSLRARDLDAVGASGIPRNALVQRFGDLFPVAIAAQLLLVGGTADERNFRQDPWHRAFRQHHEAGFPDAAVAQTRILRRQYPVKGALHTLREPSRLL